ncbi:MAG: hypothetical protein GC136_06305 [Alphaproteobacteria bacterium]|nr:hypothetical protein [Alphaproteobacteria bacterium]
MKQRNLFKDMRLYWSLPGALLGFLVAAVCMSVLIEKSFTWLFTPPFWPFVVISLWVWGAFFVFSSRTEKELNKT